MTKEKITQAIESAINYIENSLKVLEAKDENLLMNMLWHASAELEYALFLFSIQLEDKPESPQLSKGSHQKQLEMDSVLTATQTLLKETEHHVKKDEFDKAYNKVWQVRGDLLRLQEFLEKKRKKGGKTT
jgi:hypothetical protein